MRLCVRVEGQCQSINPAELEATGFQLLCLKSPFQALVLTAQWTQQKVTKYSIPRGRPHLDMEWDFVRGRGKPSCADGDLT